MNFLIPGFLKAVGWQTLGRQGRSGGQVWLRYILVRNEMQSLKDLARVAARYDHVSCDLPAERRGERPRGLDATVRVARAAHSPVLALYS
jgi:hypothetical protein